MIIDNVSYKAVSLSVYSSGSLKEDNIDGNTDFQSAANAVQDAIDVFNADMSSLTVSQDEKDRACAALMTAVNRLATFLQGKTITSANNPVAYAIEQELTKSQFGGPSIADECAKLGTADEGAAIAVLEKGYQSLSTLRTDCWNSANAQDDAKNTDAEMDIKDLLYYINQYEKATDPAQKNAYAIDVATALEKVRKDLQEGTAGFPKATDGFLVAIDTMLFGRPTGGTSLDMLLSNVLSGGPNALADFEKGLDGGGATDLAFLLQTAISKEKWS